MWIRILNVLFLRSVAAVALIATSGSVLGQVEHEFIKLLASDGASDDRFGFAVAVSGDIAVIGAFRHDNDSGLRSGSAYVFRFDGKTWDQEAKLLATDGIEDGHFGYSVALSGDTAVIGAHWDDDNGGMSGSAYVFRYDGSNWVQEAKLLASDGAGHDFFGQSVAISGDTALIGAPDDDDNGGSSGSAYVFRFDGKTWVQEAKLLATDGADNDYFGYSVAISDGRALIGAHYDDDAGGNSGSVYSFYYDGTNWVQEAKLLPSDAAPNDRFGRSVAISDDTAVVGSYAGFGSAYVFRFDGSGWTEEAKLLSSDGEQGDSFGSRVAISGDVVIVSAHDDDDNGSSSGSAYVFRNYGETWVEDVKLLASDGAVDDKFGVGVAVSGEAAVIGAGWDDDNGPESGSAYVFHLRNGDLNGNGCVDQQDLGILLAYWGWSDGGDVDGDGDTDQSDLGILLAHWGEGCP